MLPEVDWGGHDSSSNRMNGFLLSEVDWGAHDSSFFLYLVHIDHDVEQKDFFTQGLWGGQLTTKEIFHPLHGVPERFFGYWTN